MAMLSIAAMRTVGLGEKIFAADAAETKRATHAVLLAKNFGHTWLSTRKYSTIYIDS